VPAGVLPAIKATTSFRQKMRIADSNRSAASKVHGGTLSTFLLLMGFSLHR
jgi:hypothetical protein